MKISPKDAFLILQSFLADPNYMTSYKYDANGNIMYLSRKDNNTNYIVKLALEKLNYFFLIQDEKSLHSLCYGNIFLTQKKGKRNNF